MIDFNFDLSFAFILNNYLKMLKILCTYKWIPHAKQVFMHLCHTHSLFARVSLVIYLPYQFRQQFFRLSFQAIHGTVLYWMALFIHLCKQIVSIIIFLIDKSLHFQTQSTYRNLFFFFCSLLSIETVKKRFFILFHVSCIPAPFRCKYYISMHVCVSASVCLLVRNFWHIYNDA